MLELATTMSTADGLTWTSIGTLWTGFGVLLAIASFLVTMVVRPVKRGITTVNYNVALLAQAVADHDNKDREWKVQWWNSHCRLHPEEAAPSQTEMPRFVMPEFRAINGEFGDQK